MDLQELVEHAAFELVGMHPDDAHCALAAAIETFADGLVLSHPELTDRQVRALCCRLQRRVRARLKEIEAQPQAQRPH